MMRRLLVTIPLLVLFVVPGRTVEAATVRDIIDLARAGLAEEVLLALIEADQSIFAIDAKSLKALKDAGVSERVIVAMIRSGRPQPAEDQNPNASASSDPREPQVIVIEHRDAPVVQQVIVPVPVYVAVPSHVRLRPRIGAIDSVGRRFVIGSSLLEPGTFLTDTPDPPRHSEPVYWGWGGKLRPDAWKP